MVLSFKEKSALKLISYFAHLEDHECQVLCPGEDTYEQIHKIIKEKEWYNTKIGIDLPPQNIKNILELCFFDIEIDVKIYLFFSEYGIDTWQASLIISTFFIVGKIPDFDDHNLLTSLLDSIGTYVVANFIAIFGGEEFSQTIKIPQNFSVKTTNSRFMEKII